MGERKRNLNCYDRAELLGAHRANISNDQLAKEYDKHPTTIDRAIAIAVSEEEQWRDAESINREQIELLLAPYSDLQLECDGITQVIVYLLNKNKIPHRVVIGSAEVDGTKIPIHYWIVLPNGMHIDYRIRMWFGDEERHPHGVFNAEDFPHVVYRGGEPHEMKVSKSLFSILTMVGKNSWDN